MGENSGIAWTNHTFNPWIGCQKVSAGCKHCYAEQYVLGTGEDVWGPTAQRRRTGLKNWNKPLRWNKAAMEAGVRAKVFCSSLADVFEDRPELVPWREDLFALIDKTRDLDWLLLTKRPENMARMLPSNFVSAARWEQPWANLWLGTSVENQEMAKARLDYLIALPAVVRFISAEPLLERLDLTEWLDEDHNGFTNTIDWVIVGGESGEGARPFDLAWADDLIRQCRDSSRTEAKPFIKQTGAKPVQGGVPVVLKDTDAGGDMAEWPMGLRVREFPR